MSFEIDGYLLNTEITFKGKPKTQENGEKVYQIEKTLLCYVEKTKLQSFNSNIALEDTNYVFYTNFDLEDFVGGVAIFGDKKYEISYISVYKEPFDSKNSYSKGALKWQAF